MGDKTWGCINSDGATYNALKNKCVIGAILAADPTKKCPAGNYCPEGSIVPVPCAIGTYRAAE
jgi:hypothetical protein